MEQMQQKVPLNILLADDDADDRFFFEKALRELHIVTNLKTVVDGQRLMEYLFKNIDDLPDVLFLDLNMPRKNGTECLKEIKANQQLKVIPVVLCSTSLDNDFANELYQVGAHYYLHKCDFHELKKCIQKTLDLLERNAAQPAREHFMLSVQESEKTTLRQC